MPPVFRYFELVDESAGKFAFWEVAIDGPQLEVRHGPVGTAGHRELETCSSIEHARREYDLRVEAKLAEGYRECADRRLDARTRALEEAIDEAPDDIAAYMVYADWIQTLGDLRGGLIIAQIAAADGEPGAAARADAFLKQHAATFLGPLAEHVGYDGAFVEPTWRYGFIRRVRMPIQETWDDRPVKVMEALFEHASARWLEGLEVVTADFFSNLIAIVEALARQPRPRLRELVLGEVGEPYEANYDEDGASQWVRERVDLAPLWRAVPNLKRLVVRGEPLRLGVIALPQLEHLELHAVVIDPLALAAMSCPMLTRLELRYRRQESYDAFESARDGAVATRLAQVLGTGLARRLDHLAITGLQAMDDIAGAIARIRKPSLRTLDLSGGNLGDRGAETLAASGLELDIIDVSRNRLSDRGKLELEKIAKLVIAEAQKYPRY